MLLVLLVSLVSYGFFCLHLRDKNLAEFAEVIFLNRLNLICYFTILTRFELGLLFRISGAKGYLIYRLFKTSLSYKSHPASSRWAFLHRQGKLEQSHLRHPLLVESSLSSSFCPSFF